MITASCLLQNVRHAAVLLTALMLLQGCHREHTLNVQGYSLGGTISETSSLPNVQYDFTNEFRILLATNFYLIQVARTDHGMLSQATYDGTDIGRWWRPTETNRQVTAWIEPISAPSAEHALGYKEGRLLYPLLWLLPDTAEGARARLTQTDGATEFLPGLDKKAYENGLFTEDQTNGAGRLVRRSFETFVSPNHRYRRTLYEVNLSAYRGIGKASVPLQYTVTDKRQGIILSHHLHVNITNAEYEHFSTDEVYPSLNGSPTLVMDRRIPENYHLEKQPWPDRSSRTFILKWRQHHPWSPGRIVVIAVFVLLVLFPVALYWGSRYRKSKRKTP